MTGGFELAATELREMRGREEIRGLLARYGYLMDARDWGRLGSVFTADLLFDASSAGLGVYSGLAQLSEGFSRMQHPVSHHVTNEMVAVRGDDADRAEATSLWLAPRRDGRVWSGQYRDELVRTPDGWRISHRVLTVRRPKEDTF